MKHVLAEKPFLSGQGEGIHCGKPSIFIRYAGCNLRCQFGLKCPNANGRDLPEYIQNVIDHIDDYKELNDLPVFPHYCDTYVGILPQFRRFWTEYESTEELVQSTLDLIKNNPHHTDLSKIDVVFTGGEPMLFQLQMIDVIKGLSKYGLKNVTFETNGTIGIMPECVEDWRTLDKDIYFTFSISPKISSANYDEHTTCKPDSVKSYQDTFNNNDSFVLKYVVQGEEDIPVLEKYTEEYKNIGFVPTEVCLMPCGGKADPAFEEMQRKIFDLCIEYGYRYSPRLQMIWKNAWSK